MLLFVFLIFFIFQVSNLSTFNARAETLASSPLWRPLIETKRCVVVIDGFYEWTNNRGKHAAKEPHFARRRDGKLMAIAGLYDVFVPPNAESVELAADDGCEDDAGERDVVVTRAEPLFSFTLITMRASAEIRFLHDRMPCILQTDEEIDAWLSDEPFRSVSRLLRAFPAADLEIYQVPPLVNQLSNKGPQCIMPADEHARTAGIAAYFRRATPQAAAAAEAEPAVVSDVPAPPLSPLATDVPAPPLSPPADFEAFAFAAAAPDDDPDLALALQLSAQEAEAAATPSPKRKRGDDNDGGSSDLDAAAQPRRSPSSSSGQKFDFRAFLAAQSAAKS